MSYTVPTRPSPFSQNNGDPKKGGTGFRVRRPQNDTWREYGFEFTVIHPLDKPLFYIQHSAKLSGQWKYAYCLGTPAEMTNGQIQPDPLGVEQCKSILIPGYHVPLHDCTNELPEGNARTQVLYRFAIVNWTTGAVQMLDMPEMALLKFFETVQEDGQINGVVDMKKFTWTWRCEAYGGAWKNVIEPIHHQRWHSHDDLVRFFSQGNAGTRFEKIKDAFDPRQTRQQIMEALGASTAPLPGATNPPGVDLFDEPNVGVNQPVPVVPHGPAVDLAVAPAPAVGAILPSFLNTGAPAAGGVEGL